MAVRFVGIGMNQHWKKCETLEAEKTYSAKDCIDILKTISSDERAKFISLLVSELDTLELEALMTALGTKSSRNVTESARKMKNKYQNIDELSEKVATNLAI